MDSYVLTPEDLEALQFAANGIFLAGVILGLAVAPWAYWLVISGYRYLTQPKKDQGNETDSDTSEGGLQKQPVEELRQACRTYGVVHGGDHAHLDCADERLGFGLLRRQGRSALEWNDQDLPLGNEKKAAGPCGQRLRKFFNLSGQASAERKN